MKLSFHIIPIIDNQLNYFWTNEGTYIFLIWVLHVTFRLNYTKYKIKVHDVFEFLNFQSRICFLIFGTEFQIINNTLNTVVYLEFYYFLASVVCSHLCLQAVLRTKNITKINAISVRKVMG